MNKHFRSSGLSEDRSDLLYFLLSALPGVSGVFKNHLQNALNLTNSYTNPQTNASHLLQEMSYTMCKAQYYFLTLEHNTIDPRFTLIMYP